MARNAVLDRLESEVIMCRYIVEQQVVSDEFRSYVDETVSADELQVLIFNAVNKMPEQRRKIFTMSRFKGIPNFEIADMLGLNIRTVENHITNALADIRMMLTEMS